MLRGDRNQGGGIRVLRRTGAGRQRCLLQRGREREGRREDRLQLRGNAAERTACRDLLLRVIALESSGGLTPPDGFLFFLALGGGYVGRPSARR